MLKSPLKYKNRYFYHIFVSPGHAPGPIMLNVVWMKRESDAYKLSRCMCPSKYNHFWDTARHFWKIGISSDPLAFDTPVRGGGVPSEYRHPLWYGKTRMVSLPDGEKILKTSLFVLAQLTNVTDAQTDRQTDGHWVTAIAALCIASHGKNDPPCCLNCDLTLNCSCSTKRVHSCSRIMFYKMLLDR